MKQEPYELEFNRCVDKTIGPTRAERQPDMADARWVAGLYRLQPVWVGFRYGYGRFIGYYVAVSLKERPIDCTISRGRRREDADRPRIPTGDHAFDAQFLVNGDPPRVVRKVIDGSTRRWMLMVFDEMAPQFDTRDGRLRHYTSLIQGRDVAKAELRPMPTVEELTRRVEITLSLAERMTAAYDKNFRDVVRKQRAKLDRDEGKKGTHEERKRARKRQILVRYFLVALGVGLAVAVAMAMWLGQG